MSPSIWIRQSLAGILVVAVFAVNALYIQAVPPKVVGEVLIADRGAKVTVNGEVAETGRSLLSGSTIDTPSNSGAVVSLGALGKLELAPSTSITLAFNESGIKGSLASGRITVISATSGVEIVTEGGSKVLNVGESAEAGSTQTSTSGAGGNNSWIIWVAVLGGAIAGIVLATSGGNDSSTGGGTPVSPVR